MWGLELGISKERSEHLSFREPHCHADIRTNLILYKQHSFAFIFVCDCDTHCVRLSSFVFTARCTIVQLCKARYCDRMSSVRLSLCPSVCNVGGSGQHRLEILETNCTDNYPNVFALRNPKAVHLLSGEHGEIWGKIEVMWEKVACWSTITTISQKRVKIEERWRAYIGTHQLSFERYHPRPSTASSSSRLGVRNPHP